MAVIEYAENVIGLENCGSIEFGEWKNPVIEKLRHVVKKEAEFKEVHYPRQQRIGTREIILDPESKVYEIYQQKKIYERFRHRYGFN